MPTNIDQRVKKTKRDLRNAIVELLNEKPFDKITVSEICEKSMVTRMTFYKHYQDKYDLLSDTIEGIKDAILEMVPYNTNEINTIEKAAGYVKKLLEVVINYLEENIEFLKAIQRNQLDDMISTICEKSLVLLIQELYKMQPLKWPVSLVTSFCYGGFSNMLFYWIFRPKTMSKKELIGVLNQLIDSISVNNLILK